MLAQPKRLLPALAALLALLLVGSPPAAQEHTRRSWRR
jgi:hypothetical protein